MLFVHLDKKIRRARINSSNTASNIHSTHINNRNPTTHVATSLLWSEIHNCIIHSSRLSRKKQAYIAAPYIYVLDYSSLKTFRPAYNFSPFEPRLRDIFRAPVPFRINQLPFSPPSCIYFPFHVSYTSSFFFFFLSFRRLVNHASCIIKEILITCFGGREKSNIGMFTFSIM